MYLNNTYRQKCYISNIFWLYFATVWFKTWPLTCSPTWHWAGGPGCRHGCPEGGPPPRSGCRISRFQSRICSGVSGSPCLPGAAISALPPWTGVCFAGRKRFGFRLSRIQQAEAVFCRDKGDREITEGVSSGGLLRAHDTSKMSTEEQQSRQKQPAHLKRLSASIQLKIDFTYRQQQWFSDWAFSIQRAAVNMLSPNAAHPVTLSAISQRGTLTIGSFPVSFGALPPPCKALQLSVSFDHTLPRTLFIDRPQIGTSKHFSKTSL